MLLLPIVSALEFTRFEYLTFDCYGTLIDWETGILNAVRPVLEGHRRNLSDTGILELYAAIEAQQEQGEYRSYREILDSVMMRMAIRLGFRASDQEVRVLSESMPGWLPFPEVVPALKLLRQRYKLAIISNVDDDLIAESLRHLEVPFEHVITAEQCRSYKPSLNNFRTALKRLAVPGERVLHVAQSLYHDIVPAKQLGLTTVWVNRHAGRKGGGATPPASAEADLEVPDLAALVVAARGLPP
jgi:2-haloacid dehalogenase